MASEAPHSQILAILDFLPFLKNKGSPRLEGLPRKMLFLCHLPGVPHTGFRPLISSLLSQGAFLPQCISHLQSPCTNTPLPCSVLLHDPYCQLIYYAFYSFASLPHKEFKLHKGGDAILFIVSFPVLRTVPAMK